MQPCFVEPKQLAADLSPPREKALTPRWFREQKKQPPSLSRTHPRFRSSVSLSLSLASHPFKSEVSKNMASYSAHYNSEEEKREKAVPPSWAD